MAKRIQVRLSDELAAKIYDWSKRLGVTQSQLSAMSIQAGLGAILRAVAPDEAISPETLLRIMKLAQEEGINLEGVKDGPKLKD